ESLREWQRALRGEIRQVERGIKRIEQDEEKIKKDAKAMAKNGGDPQSIKLLAKSLVRSSKAKGRLYTARANLSAASSEMANQAATMRLADAMTRSTAVMQQMNALVKVPELHEAMSSMQREMIRAGLIDELIDEGMEDMDGPELEQEAADEVDKVLEDLAIDASVRLAITRPAQASVPVASPAAAAPAAPAVAAEAPAA
ncbi:unnamed protein product, partial [Prorocentrum cordatum]